MGRTEPTGRLQASLGRHGKASKETNEDHSFGVQRRGVSKKDLTEPTLLEITGSRGNGYSLCANIRVTRAFSSESFGCRPGRPRFYLVRNMERFKPLRR